MELEVVVADWCYCHVFWSCHLFVIQLLSDPHFRFYRGACKKQTGMAAGLVFPLTCRYKTRLGLGAAPRYRSHVSASQDLAW